MNILQNEWVEEEITLAEFSERFLCNIDFKTPAVYLMDDFNIEVQTLKEGKLTYEPIKTFLVKPPVKEHWTDGRLKGTANHRIVEEGQNITLKEHSDFKLVDQPMDVVDIEVDSKEHTYLANGRVNHNTTSGGKSTAFHSSVRIRLKSVGKIKATNPISKDNEVVGIKTQAEIVKNRMGPPNRKVEFDIYYDSGLDEAGGILGAMKSYKLVKHSGAWYTYISKKTGEEIKFMSKEFESSILNHPHLREEILDELAPHLTLTYKANVDGGIDDIELEREVSEKEENDKTT